MKYIFLYYFRETLIKFTVDVKQERQIAENCILHFHETRMINAPKDCREYQMSITLNILIRLTTEINDRWKKKSCRTQNAIREF